MKDFAGAIAIVCAAASGLIVGCSGSGSPEASVQPETVGATSTSIPAATQTEPATAADADADVHGFTVFGDGARCLGTDTAEMFMRTEASALVVCLSEVDRLYYRGYRISDGATIDLYDVSGQSGSYVALNPPDNARYVISPDGFQLIQNGTVVSQESAVETGPPGLRAPAAEAAPAAETPATQAASTILLGTASGLGANARGYGTEQPSAISMGSCPSAISQIVWHDWGAAVAHGKGLGCVQYGPQPEYQLIASDLGTCRGVMAYRELRIGTAPEETNTADARRLCEG